MSTSPKSRKNCIHNGVTTTPINTEIVALKMAAGTFPQAMETITTEEDTVEGKAARKKKESQKSPCSCVWINGWKGSKSKGNNTNVTVCTRRWSRQLRNPAFSC